MKKLKSKLQALVGNITVRNIMEHFNKLTPAELERLAILSEECGEKYEEQIKWKTL